MSKTIEQRLDDIMAVLVGGHDSTGKYYPGLSPRVQHLEHRVDHIEKATEKANENRLTFGRGVALTAVGGAIAQTLAWVKDHLPK
jgi:hypothetical protein